jgi:hypothetical protein
VHTARNSSGSAQWQRLLLCISGHDVIVAVHYCATAFGQSSPVASSAHHVVDAGACSDTLLVSQAAGVIACVAGTLKHRGRHTHCRFSSSWARRPDNIIVWLYCVHDGLRQQHRLQRSAMRLTTQDTMRSGCVLMGARGCGGDGTMVVVESIR